MERNGRRRAKLSEKLKSLIGRTRVFALVGSSGTGKSFRAKLIAEKYGIEYIIDDGLLIHRNSIVAGKSAKREKVYMSAIKTALFDDVIHQHEVIKAIQSRKIRKILLIGTSERMATRTAKRLKLPPPSKIISIEEISTANDIEKAQRSRNEEGKHVIPVPTIQVERDYPHLISKSIKVLFKIGRGFSWKKKADHKVFEKSVVRPAFHDEERGHVSISEQAMGKMIAHLADEFDGELIVKKVRIDAHHGVYRFRVEVEVPGNRQLNDNLHELRGYMINRIEKYTGIIIEEFNLVITGIKSL